MSHHYRVYGLHLKTNRPVGLLAAQTADKPDLVVNWRSNGQPSPTEHLKWERVLTAELRQRNGITLWRAPTPAGISTRLRFSTPQGHVEFHLDERQGELWITHSKEDTEADLHSFFVGPALGCVLRLRGTLCLHASVVKIDDQAIAIVGRKKSGKSTSAAGLAQLGAAVLSDDMAVLNLQSNHFLVQPGYPQIRLWPQSIEAIYPATGHLPKVYSHRDKRYLPLDVEGGPGGTFWPWPLVLSAIYILEESNDSQALPRIEDVPPQDKLMALIRNTFGSYVVTDENRRREFTLLAQLSKTIPIRRLVFAHDLTSLPAQSNAIVEDVRRLIG
jgi:hypothetical protein